MNSPSQLFLPQRLVRHELVILLALVLGCRLAALWALPVQDEAFVAFRYARNLAGGAGLVFNPGEPWEPVLGTCAPGFAALLALLLRCGIEPTLSAPVLGVCGELASAWLLVELLGRRRLACAAALFAFALLPQLERIGAGCGSGPLFTALALGSLLARERERGRLCGTLAGLSLFLRPEGLVLMSLIAASALGSREFLRRFAPPALFFALLVFGALLAVYGDPIPQPLSAAQPGVAAALLEGLRGRSLGGWILLALLLPFALRGFAGGFTRGLALGLLGLVVLAQLGLLAGGVVPCEAWSLHLGLAALCAWIGRGAEALLERWHGWLSHDTLELARQRAIAFGGPLLLLGCGAAAAARRDPVTERVHGPLEEYARAVGRLEPRARVLASEAGALAWGWSGSVIDCSGRTFPLLALYGDPARRIRVLRPEYLCLRVERASLEPFFADTALRAEYAPVARFSVLGETELEPALDLLPADGQPDFLLYRRRDLEDALLR